MGALLGAFPEISLKKARRLRDEARQALAEGADPARKKQAEKASAKLGAENNFATISPAFVNSGNKRGHSVPGSFSLMSGLKRGQSL